MHAYLISEAETEERRAQRLRAVAAALEESLANGACVGFPPVLFDHDGRDARRKGSLGRTETTIVSLLEFALHLVFTASKILFFSGAPFLILVFFTLIKRTRLVPEAAADESEAARAIAEAQKAAHEYETVATVGHHEHVQHAHTSTEV